MIGRERKISIDDGNTCKLGTLSSMLLVSIGKSINVYHCNRMQARTHAGEGEHTREENTKNGALVTTVPVMVD